MPATGPIAAGLIALAGTSVLAQAAQAAHVEVPTNTLVTLATGAALAFIAYLGKRAVDSIDKDREEDRKKIAKLEDQVGDLRSFAAAADQRLQHLEE